MCQQNQYLFKIITINIDEKVDFLQICIRMELELYRSFDCGLGRYVFKVFQTILFKSNKIVAFFLSWRIRIRL